MIKPNDVLCLTEPTKDYLCSLDANKYKINFIGFKIRDLDSGKVIHDVSVDPNLLPEDFQPDESSRFIKYDFGASFLKLKNIGSTITFKVSSSVPVPDFRMIERHYFGNKLIKSFDFSFGFCIPKSINTRETIYSMPGLGAKEEMDMIANPYETKSDSFYFVGDELVMHIKAEYAFSFSSEFSFWIHVFYLHKYFFHLLSFSSAKVAWTSLKMISNVFGSNSWKTTLLDFGSLVK